MIALVVDSRNVVTGGECYQRLALAREQRAASNQQRIRPCFGKLGECALERLLAGRLTRTILRPAPRIAASTSGSSTAESGIGGVRQDGNQTGVWHQLEEQLDPLGTELTAGKEGHAGEIAARPVKRPFSEGR